MKGYEIDKMLNLTYKQAIEKGFEPSNPIEDRNYPNYLRLRNDKITIIMAHSKEGIYKIHRLVNPSKRQYYPEEIENIKRFTEVKSLKGLINVLERDKKKGAPPRRPFKAKQGYLRLYDLP